MDNWLKEVPEIPYEHHTVVTGDGVSLATQAVGSGPVVLLINGIGVTKPGLDLIVDRLRGDYRVISWDYRGIGESVLPSRNRAMRMERHAGDGLQILDAYGQSRAVVLGWSMGVPVGLEMIRRAPHRVAGFAALFGAPGPPFRAAFSDPVAHAVETMFRLSYRYPQVPKTILNIAVKIPWFAWSVSSGVRFVGPWANRSLFLRDVESTASADKWAYFKTMCHLLVHDASDVLPKITCPTLVVAGTEDWVTPQNAAEEMAQMAPDARLVILERTTHFGVIEHGPQLWNPIVDLLNRAYR